MCIKKTGQSGKPHAILDSMHFQSLSTRPPHSHPSSSHPTLTHSPSAISCDGYDPGDSVLGAMCECRVLLECSAIVLISYA